MSFSDAERDAMRDALVAARKGPRGVNPQVGAVILSPSGATLAIGWHRGSGTAHAEVDALAQLAPHAAQGATAVVTLEPCNHTGRTGPCTLALRDAGIARVVYALDDPGEQSSGGGERLRHDGIEVESGLNCADATELLASWLTVQRLGRPHVTVKWAQSLDGRAAAADGSSQWITGAPAREDVHRRRALADAIVVGTGTALSDNPSLTARLPNETLFPHQPRPVVIGSRQIPADASLRHHPHAPWFFGSDLRRSPAATNAPDTPAFAATPVDLAAVLHTLGQRGVHRVFVEGGPRLASSFVRAGLVDELLIYIAPVLLGGGRLALGDIGVDSIGEARRLDVITTVPLGADVLMVAAPVAAPIKEITDVHRNY